MDRLLSEIPSAVADPTSVIIPSAVVDSTMTNILPEIADSNTFLGEISSHPKTDQLHVGTCNHGVERSEVIRIVRNVGKEPVSNPGLPTLCYDSVIGPGLIYSYPITGTRKVNVEDLNVSDSDQVWKFQATILKHGKGKGLQKKKVGICPFCADHPELVKPAIADKVVEDSNEIDDQFRAQLSTKHSKENVLNDLLILAPYYVRYKSRDSKLKVYMDLYINMWGSAGETWFRYSPIPSDVIAMVGTAIDETDNSNPPAAEPIPPAAESIPPAAESIPPSADSIPPAADSIPPVDPTLPTADRIDNPPPAELIPKDPNTSSDEWTQWYNWTPPARDGRSYEHSISSNSYAQYQQPMWTKDSGHIYELDVPDAECEWERRDGRDIIPVNCDWTVMRFAYIIRSFVRDDGAKDHYVLIPPSYRNRPDYASWLPLFPVKTSSTNIKQQHADLRKWMGFRLNFLMSTARQVFMKYPNLKPYYKVGSDP